MDERSVERWNNAMKIKGLIDEDFVNYKVPSMFIITAHCSFKCDKECGKRVCQNGALAKRKPIQVDKAELCHRYMSNRISKAMVFGGLEPFDQFNDVLFIIRYLRCSFCKDDVVIYTGYNKEEIADKVEMLKQFPNIVIKFGRYIPDQTPHFDPVLGINLASDNQYAEKIS